MKKYKINIHLTESCNFHCKYCFAHFEKHNILSEDNWKKIIDNCIESGLIKEINFAGGEPLVCRYLMDIVHYVNNKGIPCSIITNGSFLTEEWIKNNAYLFKTIGISFDSVKPKTIRNIGRCSANGEMVDGKKLVKISEWLKKYSPDVKLKINTVVNAFNKNEKITDFILKNQIPVSRLKFLKTSYFSNGKYDNSSLLITDDEFYNFAKNNLSVLKTEAFSKDKILYKAENPKEIVVENSLKGSYLMIDVGGYLVDNTQNSNYIRIINCLNEPFAKGIDNYFLNEKLYNSRY